MKSLLLFGAIALSISSFAQNNFSTELDGATQYVNIPSSADFDALNTEMSVTAWINPNTLSPVVGPRILDRAEGNGGGFDRWLLAWTPNSKNNVMSFAVGAGSTEVVYGSTPVNLNEWTFVCATFNAGNVKVYINGIEDGSGTIGFTDLLHVQGVDLNIGSVNGNNSFFPGLIDEVTLWDVAINSTTVLELMDCPPNGDETGLIGYWDFEEGTGTVAGDVHSNSNDGILMNSVLWSTNVQNFNCGVGLTELNNAPKQLLKIVDLMGRETPYKPNTVLIYVYDDGSTEKVFKMED